MKKNIAYITTENKHTETNRIIEYCKNIQIELHEIITNEEELMDLCKRKNYISNLIIINLKSLGSCTSSRLEPIKCLKENNKNANLHIIDLYFTFGKKNLNKIVSMGKKDDRNGFGYFMLTMISAFIDFGDEIIDDE